jgi:hypothetical protein
MFYTYDYENKTVRNDDTYDDNNSSNNFSSSSILKSILSKGTCLMKMGIGLLLIDMGQKVISKGYRDFSGR